jgi:hypothetical protein
MISGGLYQRSSPENEVNMALFSDPVSWLRSSLGSPLRLGGLICWQFIVGVALIFKIEMRYGLSFFTVFIIPCMFYYATYRVLKLYDTKVGEPGNWRKVPDWFIFLIYILAGLGLYILV